MIKTGDVYYCDFGDHDNSVQSGKRPCIIVDNAMACAYSPCIHCVPLTTQDKKRLPLHYKLKEEYCKAVDKDSVALCEQYQLVDKSQLIHYIGRLSRYDLANIVELCKKNLPFNYK